MTTEAQLTHLQGSGVLLIGIPGSGKTYSLSTLISAGLETFVITTDPGGLDALLDSMSDRKLPMDKLHYHYCPPATASWDDLLQQARKISMLDYKGVKGMKAGDKTAFANYLQFLSRMKNFIDDRTGEEFGAVDSWPASSNRAIVVDTLTGVNAMALRLMIGGNPTAHEGEWGVAMGVEELLLQTFTSDIKCFGVMTGHIDYDRDFVNGTIVGRVSLLGQKLAPKIPRLFGDVVAAINTGGDFHWSTIAYGLELKTRSLPHSDKLEPSFEPIVRKWRERNAALTASQQPSIKEEQAS